MIERLLELRSDRIALYHVRMAFSEDMESVGKFAPRKLWVLFTTILRIAWARIKFRTPVLYYPPSGPNKVPVLRDLILLGATRWMFSKVVFHFHAGGVSTYEKELPFIMRPLFRLAYREPALAIRTAPQNPDDGLALGAERCSIVPNGVEDMRGTVPEVTAAPDSPITILFTGVLIPSKGVTDLLNAFYLATKQGLNARLQLMGKWGSSEYERECKELVITQGVADRVEFLGVLSGEEKFKKFAACDIFCFPSYFEAESFGLVLVEAMQFAKPVISSQWRGIPSVVNNGENGFLVPVRDPAAVAAKMVELGNDPELRRKMGEAGRRIFTRDFTLNAFHRAMERELLGLFEKN